MALEKSRYFVIFHEKNPKKCSHKCNPKPNPNRKTNLNLNPNFQNMVKK